MIPVTPLSSPLRLRGGYKKGITPTQKPEEPKFLIYFYRIPFFLIAIQYCNYLLITMCCQENAEQVTLKRTAMAPGKHLHVSII
jgi:hypothetical protein